MNCILIRASGAIEGNRHLRDGEAGAIQTQTEGGGVAEVAGQTALHVVHAKVSVPCIVGHCGERCSAIAHRQQQT